MSNQKLLLTDAQIRQKITRLAYEIYETHYNHPKIVLAGIKNRGLQIAQLLAEALRKISPLEVTVTDIRIKKTAPIADPPTVGIDLAQCTHLPIVIIDDVASSGKTLLHALKPFMYHDFLSIKIAVLINRSHKLFPITPDYVGYSLSTTLQEHIEVVFDAQNGVNAYIK